MDTFHALILGIIQGFTEFLPISSSAHLTLAPYFFNWNDPGLAFDVALHMGTLAAILIAFSKDWIEVIKQVLNFLGIKKFEYNSEFVDFRWIILGSFPAAIAGLLFEKQAEEAFRSPVLIVITLSVFAFVLWKADTSGKKSKTISSVGMKEALIIGCAQALAIVPGVSRSGITITAGLFLGLARPSALRFSFLLSAPIIAGAGLVKFKHILALISQGGTEAQSVMYGFIASFITGLVAIYFLNKLVKTKTFLPFVIYRYVLSAVIIAVYISK